MYGARLLAPVWSCEGAGRLQVVIVFTLSEFSRFDSFYHAMEQGGS